MEIIGSKILEFSANWILDETKRNIIFLNYYRNKMVCNYEYPRQGSTADKEHVWDIIAKLEEKNKTDGSEVRRFIDKNGFASFAEDFLKSSRKTRFSTPPRSLEKELVFLLADLINWSCDGNLMLINNLMYLLGYLSYDSKPLRFRQKIENMKKKVRKVLGRRFENFSSTLYRAWFPTKVNGSNTLATAKHRPVLEGERPTLPTVNPSYQVASAQDCMMMGGYNKEDTATNVMNLGETPNMNLGNKQHTTIEMYDNAYDNGVNSDVLDDLPLLRFLPDWQEYLLREGNAPTPTPSTTQLSRGRSNSGLIALPGVPKNVMTISNTDVHIQLPSMLTPSHNGWDL